MHKTQIDIDANIRKKSIAILQQLLSDSVIVMMQTKQAHWNVKGPQFIALHELFDKIHGELGAHVDDIAERIVTLGGHAYGTVYHAAKNSKIDEYPLDLTDGQAHVETLSARMAQLGKAMRQGMKDASDAGDENTADILTGISNDLDKSLWFIEAHLG